MSPLPFSFLPDSWASPHWSAQINNQFVCLFSAFLPQDSPIEHGGQSPNQNDCGTWVRNINGGVFTSPNYPNTYPPNKECVYILEGTAGRSLDALSASLCDFQPLEKLVFSFKTSWFCSSFPSEQQQPDTYWVNPPPARVSPQRHNPSGKADERVVG